MCVAVRRKVFVGISVLLVNFCANVPPCKGHVALLMSAGIREARSYQLWRVVKRMSRWRECEQAFDLRAVLTVYWPVIFESHCIGVKVNV